MRAWAWVQTERVSLRVSPVQELREQEERNGEGKEKEGESRDEAREANGEEDKKDIGEKESLVRERRDRVPGGQDRFELSKIYGRRFDLRARGVTPGSLGQGP